MVFQKIRIGSKVRIKDFPPPAGQAVPFDYNGLIGEVKDIKRVGFGLGNKPVHSYDVVFSGVEVPFTQVDPTSGKLIRGIRQGGARNWFDETYVEFYADPEPAKVVEEKEVPTSTQSEDAKPDESK